MKVLKSLLKESKRLVNFEATESERRRIFEKAEKYCNGNMSEWIRYAAVNHEPNEEELIAVKRV